MLPSRLDLKSDGIGCHRNIPNFLANRPLVGIGSSSHRIGGPGLFLAIGFTPGSRAAAGRLEHFGAVLVGSYTGDAGRHYYHLVHSGQHIS